MKLKATFKENCVQPFLHVLKGLKEFKKFDKESFICFRFSEKYLYISGNEDKYLNIMVTINIYDLLHENFIIKSSNKNEIIFLVYISQLYDIFKNAVKDSTLSIELSEKNGFCILLFQNYCPITYTTKRFECGIEIINPMSDGFPKKHKITSNSLSIICKLKKCCKILKAYSRFYTKKVTLTFLLKEKSCDIAFCLDCVLSKNITVLKKNHLQRNKILNADLLAKMAHSGHERQKEEINDIQESPLETNEENKNQKYNNIIDIEETNETNLMRVLHKKKLACALNVLNDCRNAKEDAGIFKMIIPYNEPCIALSLTNFETTGNWKISIIISDVT